VHFSFKNENCEVAYNWNDPRHFMVMNKPVLSYKRGNVRITWHWGAFVQPLLPWESNKCCVFWLCLQPLVSRMQWACATLSSLACPVLHYFSISSHKRHDFPKKILNMKCVFDFSLQHFFDTFFVLRITERNMIKKFMLVFMSDFNETWILWTN